MRAVQITTLDGPHAVEVVRADEPTMTAESVLIDVHVAGVTFSEVSQSHGEYHVHHALPFIPGAEVAGVVRSVPSSSAFVVGQRVAAFAGMGGYAESVAVPSERVFALPDEVSFGVGAALLMNYMTMHFALVRRARLQPSETALVHGAAGGIGTAAVQLASALGAKVIAVVSDSGKAKTATAAGADEVVTADAFEQMVQELTGDRGVDVIVDPVGAHRVAGSLRSLAREGRLLIVGSAGGDVAQVKVDALMGTNISVLGVGWGAFWAEQPSYLQQQWNELLPLVRAGTLIPVIGGRHSLEHASTALLELETRRAHGKLLLDVQ